MADNPLRHPDSDSTEVVSEINRKKIDEYTIATRGKNDEFPEQPGPLKRLTNAIESKNKKLWARFFKRILHNPIQFDRIPISKLESILVIPFGDAIGDLIVSVPIFRAIKQRNPNCRVGTFISHRNEALLRCDSDVDDRYLFKDRLDFKHYPELLRARRVKYQVVINMHFVRMTEYGLLANVVSPRALKVSTKHGRSEQYQILFNKLACYDRDSMHLAQLGLTMLGMVVDMEPAVLQSEAQPSIKICLDTRERVAEQLKRAMTNLGATWFIYFNTQARMSFREWGVENTAEFSRRFAECYPEAAIIFTASPIRQNEVKKEIDSHNFKRSIFFNTSYDLLEIAALAEASRLVITPDTSVIHFGVAAKKPTLVLWSNRDLLPMDWIPLQVPSRNLAPSVKGNPVSSISVDEVWQAVTELLENPSMPTQTSFDPTTGASDLYQAQSGNEPLAELISRTLSVDSEGVYRLVT